MRRRNNPKNIWFLLALPFVGTLGWLVGWFVGRRSPAGRGRTTLAVPEQAEGAAGERSPRETGPKEPERETKNLPLARQKGGVAVPSARSQELQAGHALANQPERLSTFLVLLIPFLILPIAVIVLAFHHLPVQSQTVVSGGDPNRGRADLQAWGCGACHTIEGVTGATGTIGPALNSMSNRSYIAGHLRNTPDNMVQWIMRPQQISPGVDMPDSGVPTNVARDMAAYLYSIK